MFVKIMPVLMFLNMTAVRLIDNPESAAEHVVSMITSQCGVVEEEMIDVSQAFNWLSKPLLDSINAALETISDPEEKTHLPATIVFTFSDDCKQIELLVVYTDKELLSKGILRLHKGDNSSYKVHPEIQKKLIKENGTTAELDRTILMIMSNITNAEMKSKRKKIKPFFEFLSGSADLLERGGPSRYLNGDESVPWPNIFKIFATKNAELKDK